MRDIGAAVAAGALTCVLVAGCAAPGTAPVPSPRPPRTFVLHPGQTRTIRPDGWRPGDRVSCPGHGGAAIGPAGTAVGGSLGVDVETHADGTVVARCEAGPPPNA